jgi:hypothetical protein
VLVRVRAHTRGMQYAELRRKVHALEERCAEVGQCRVTLEKMLQQVRRYRCRVAKSSGTD